MNRSPKATARCWRCAMFGVCMLGACVPPLEVCSCPRWRCVRAPAHTQHALCCVPPHKPNTLTPNMPTPNIPRVVCVPARCKVSPQRHTRFRGQGLVSPQRYIPFSGSPSTASLAPSHKDVTIHPQLAKHSPSSVLLRPRSLTPLHLPTTRPPSSAITPRMSLQCDVNIVLTVMCT